MSSIYGSNQSPRVTTGFLNTVNDPAPGVPLASPSGSIVQPYTGQVGGKLTLSTKEALALSDTVGTGTLFQGVYMYVLVLSTAAAAMVRGQILYWNDRANYIVTTDPLVATQGNIAGIALSVITRGQYGFIQIAGIASVKFRAALTKVAVAGDLVVQDATPTATGDVILDATGLTSPVQKGAVGIAQAVPANGAISTVALTFNPNVY